jgi:cytochrome P450
LNTISLLLFCAARKAYNLKGVAYLVGSLAYNVWFHPLRNFPGPLYLRATRLGYIYHAFKGDLSFAVLGLHERYGEVVRIAPNELAFANPSAWQDIQGHRPKGQQEFEKSQVFYRPVGSMGIDIVSAGREEHGLLRRSMSHGFSEKSLREQQPLIMKYIDVLIRRLSENSGDGKSQVDIMSWYNFTTFDIIGDLAFGEPFGCLDSSDYHPWVRIIFKMARAGVVLQGLAYYPTLQRFVMSLVPRSFREENQAHEDLTKEKLLRRMEIGERPDLIEGLLKRKDEWVSRCAYFCPVL